MSEQPEQILAVFVLDDDVAARRFLKAVEKIDDVDDNVRIVDAAFADRTKRGRVKVQQTTGHGRGRSTGIGVVVGASLAGPAGAVVGGAAGGILAGLHHGLNDIGVTEKFMREVAGEVEKGKSALFVLYEGDWSASIGLIEKAVTAEHALLIQSTLPLATAAALKALVEPAVEELGGEEMVADYEVEMVAEATDAAAAPIEGAETATDGRRSHQHQWPGPEVRGGVGGSWRGQLRPARRDERTRTAPHPHRGARHGAAECQHLVDAGGLRRQGRLARLGQVRPDAVPAGQAERQGRGATRPARQDR